MDGGGAESLARSTLEERFLEKVEANYSQGEVMAGSTLEPTIGLAVGTFGDEWEERGKRALKTAVALNDFDAWYHCHADTLSEARNSAAEMCGEVDCLVFMDADDMVANGYSQAMRTRWQQAAMRSDHQSWLVQPATRGIYPDGSLDDEAVLIPPKNLYDSNFMVIGTMVEKRIFEGVGGFRDFPVIEDWDLWIRCVLAGSGIVQQPDAVYGVGVNPGSRNTNSATHGKIYGQIRREFAHAKDTLRTVGLAAK